MSNVVPFADAPPHGVSQRLPPTNVQAEQGLLGSLLANSAKAYPLVADFLRPEHFADPVNGRIFRAIARRAESNQVADAITLRAEFENSGELVEVGGAGYLTSLVASMVSMSHTRGYGLAVHDAFVRRQIIDAGEALVANAFSSTDAVPDVHALLQRHQQELLGLSEEAARGVPVAGRGGATSLDDAMQQALEQADEAARRGGPSGLLTGMPSVDDVLGGLEPGEVFVLGGRPGSGKSALGHQWALDVARRGIGVLELSLEMSALQLGRRALSVASGVPVLCIRLGQHSEDIGLLLKAKRELSGLPLSIEDGGWMSVEEIALKCRMAQQRHGIGLIMVDHLHIVKPDGGTMRAAGATQAIAQISQAMKALAKANNCPVLLLAQLNRSVESRDDHRPTLADLRQSGAIEQDADAVAFVYRAELHMRKSPPDPNEGETPERHAARVNDYHTARERVRGVAELIFEKVREGEPQTVPLRFDGPTSSFWEVRDHG